MNTGKTILSVSNINLYIKSLLAYDPNLSSISVRGEISNYKRYSSGHAYFSLKDATGVLKCVLFQSYFSKLNFVPADGMRVIATGSVNVYERDGIYQLYVQSMEPDGIGSLYEQFESLKKKLEQEGLFAQERKRSIPLLPKAVAVVTSASGAVIEDIRNVSSRRYPGLPVLLYPASVQGAGSCEELIASIERANEDRKADVIIVGRGGGSLEDLWSFNDERLARCVFASHLPVISAVGHETDFTICDFVADLRAPTPSAAAELAVPEESALRIQLMEFTRKLQMLPNQNIALKMAKLEQIAAHPYFTRPYERVERQYEVLMGLEERFLRALNQIFEDQMRKIEGCETHLRLLNPRNILQRGYAVIADPKGTVITTACALKHNQHVDILMQDGTVHAEINVKEKSV